MYRKSIVLGREKKMNPMIKVEGLKKYFGDVKAVDDISFQVEKGELFGFLGVNGAGKSTTINMLCTLYLPTVGKAEICGFPVGERMRKSGNGLEWSIRITVWTIS